MSTRIHEAMPPCIASVRIGLLGNDNKGSYPSKHVPAWKNGLDSLGEGLLIRGATNSCTGTLIAVRKCRRIVYTQHCHQHPSTYRRGTIDDDVTQAT
jgi:hypothetical protein